MLLLHQLPLYVTLASAQYLVPGSSFGQDDKISPNHHGIPGWHVSGEGQVPELLMDKVVLTPGYKGNVRGALWAESMNPQSEWVSQSEFRTNGPERGGGNLQIWYAKDGQSQVGSSSIYTVGHWDGFALVIDSYGGKGGGIRGFMNDGTIDYKNYHSVDSLAFGHCDYSYRNLGRPSKLQIKQEHSLFEVIVDDKLCFSTDKIQMPKEYYFGITAGSAETPDSFEINKFMVFSSDQQEEPFRAVPPPPPQHQVNSPPQTPASQYTSSEAQFEDLHNRLQTLAQSVENLVHYMDSIMGEVQRLGSDSSGRHNEIIRNTNMGDRLHTLESKLDGVTGSIQSLDSRFGKLQMILKDSHDTLSESLPKHVTNVLTSHGPRTGLLIFMFVMIQITLVGAYSLYRRRVKQGPKKYL